MENNLTKLNFKLLNFLQEYKYALAIFLISRIIVFLTLYLTNSYNLGLGSLVQWDAQHYLSIAANGYVFNGQYLNEGSFIAFFPLYPMLVRALYLITNLDITGLAIALSFIFGAASAMLLYKIVKLWAGKDGAINSVFLLSFFPMSVFLSAPYTESLFIFLTLLTFWFIGKKNFWAAGIVIALAIATRITGFVLLPILVLELIVNKKNFIYSLATTLVTVIPFAWFIYFQYLNYGTPFAFIIAQKINWHHEAVFPWIGLKNFMGYLSGNKIMYKVDFFFLLLMVITLIISARHVGRNIWLFGWGIIILTLSQSFILGLSRYMMLVIPFYFCWGKFFVKHTYVKQLVIIVMASWMVFNTVLFVLSKNIF